MAPEGVRSPCILPDVLGNGGNRALFLTFLTSFGYPLEVATLVVVQEYAHPPIPPPLKPPLSPPRSHPLPPQHGRQHPPLRRSETHAERRRWLGSAGRPWRHPELPVLRSSSIAAGAFHRRNRRNQNLSCSEAPSWRPN